MKVEATLAIQRSWGVKLELTLAFWPFLASKSKSLSRSSASGELDRESEFDFKPKTG